MAAKNRERKWKGANAARKPETPILKCNMRRENRERDGKSGNANF